MCIITLLEGARSKSDHDVGRCAAFEVFKDPRNPKLVHTVEPETITSATGLSWPHTSHCLGSGEVVIRCLQHWNPTLTRP